ncbi:MAG: hypothetical protein QM831_08950 [Kofleriaceae bacterium]
MKVFGLVLGAVFGALVAIGFATPTIVLARQLGITAIATFWVLQAFATLAASLWPFDISEQRSSVTIIVHSLASAAFAFVLMHVTLGRLVPELADVPVMYVAGAALRIAAYQAIGVSIYVSEVKKQILLFGAMILFALVPMAISIRDPDLWHVYVGSLVASSIAFLLPLRYAPDGPFRLPRAKVADWLDLISGKLALVLVATQVDLRSFASYVAITSVAALLFMALSTPAEEKSDHVGAAIGRGIVLTGAYFAATHLFGAALLRVTYPEMAGAAYWFPTLAWFGIALVPIAVWGADVYKPGRSAALVKLVWIAAIVGLALFGGVPGKLYALTISTTIQLKGARPKKPDGETPSGT